MRPPLRAAALAVALVLARAASAQAPAPTQAEALFTQAREKMHAGDYARPLLVESQRLDPAAGTLLNLDWREAVTLGEGEAREVVATGTPRRRSAW